MTMTVNLGEALERSVEDLVANGRYGSRSEVLREGVRLVEEREREISRVRLLVDEGLADMEAGRFSPIEEARARLSSRMKAMVEEPAV